MRALWRWWTRPRAGRPAARPAVDERAAALARPYAERLADDERLRGGLTDDGFGPLLSWTTDLLVHVAERIDPVPDDGALADAGAAARTLMIAISHAAASGDLDALAAALGPPLLTPAERARVLAALPRDLAGDASPDDRARAIVAALAAALPGAPR